MKSFCINCNAVTPHFTNAVDFETGNSTSECDICGTKQAARDCEPKLNNNVHLIVKALLNRGGSSSETYVHKILTGDINEKDLSIAEMWNYFDSSLKDHLRLVLVEVCDVSIDGLTDEQIVKVLIDNAASRGGRRAFWDAHSRAEIDRMDDDDYEQAIKDSINEKRRIILDAM